MNKKFSTLLSGFLLMSAFASANVSFDRDNLKLVEFNEGKVVKGTYFLVQETDGKDGITDGDRVLSVVKNSDGTLTYDAYIVNTGAEAPTAQSAYVWTLEIKEGVDSYHYAFKNAEAGTYLTFSKTTGEAVTDAGKSEKAELGTDNSSYFVAAQGNVASTVWSNGSSLYLYGAETANALYFGDGTTMEVKVCGDQIDGEYAKFYLCQYKENDFTSKEGAATLNDVKGGEGFNLAFSVNNEYEWANDILTDLNLKAFYVEKAINAGNTDFEIPVGIYLATEYPASLAGKNVISTLSQFKACTFVAVNPDSNYNINAAASDGQGFELMTIEGSKMNFYSKDDDSDDASVKGEVYVGNACFTVTEPDPLGAPGEYNFKLANFRHLKDLTKTEHMSSQGLYIGFVADRNENFMITSPTALAFTTTNSTLYDVTKLLKSEDAPSIYTIQFVSEVNKATASEKGQYLTVGVQNNVFALHAVEDINTEDPMFQFVITAVDKENKTVTFTNRQTKVSFTASLYENVDGSFTVYANNPLWISTVDDNDVNSVVEFVNIDKNDDVITLQNMKVILTPVTVRDRYATFVKRADNAGLVTFELANNIDDAAQFYVGATKDNNGNITEGDLLAYTNEAVQFELIPDKKAGEVTIDTKTIANNYVYLKDERVLNSTKTDYIAYYTYQIKAFTGDNNEYYVDIDNQDNVVLSEDVGVSFIIKNNVDGSVSLIPVDNLTLSGIKYLKVNNDELNVKQPESAWVLGNNYNLKSKLSGESNSIGGLKTFMVDENPTLSYEAIPQHVSFQAVRGGFLTKDENNDAVLSITNMATEDLTFWLDTVHSDRNVPYFYIMKNGSFMYNATDSARVYSDKGNYRFNMEDMPSDVLGLNLQIPKLIFKAGELVTSDTLRTVVNGQSVLVAEKDNAPKGIKGGLKNFQFQIIQAEEGSDEYLIRNDRYQYVCQYNNYFCLMANKDAAYRFVIEKQAAPTANEGIEVSEVKVIAGNGQITIMGAAGKKVVVSNILGKVVASQTITTDNATIAVPAGIVAVAVEGEAAVKAIVK